MSVTVDDVIQYLKQNPEFWEKHGDDVFAEELGENVVDFQQVLFAKLRNRITDEETKKQALYTLGQENYNTFTSIQNCVLEALSSENIVELLETVHNEWVFRLGVDVITLTLEGEVETVPKYDGLQIVPTGRISNIMDGNVCHAVARGTQTEIFGKYAFGIESYVMVDLQLPDTLPKAAIAFGVKKKDIFHPESGSEALRFLACALGLILQKWLILT